MNKAREFDQSVLAELKALLGERVTTSAAVREHHGKDESYFPYALPDAVVFVESTEEVRDVVNICRRRRGPGSGPAGGLAAAGRRDRRPHARRRDPPRPRPARGLRDHDICPTFCTFAPICRRDRARSTRRTRRWRSGERARADARAGGGDRNRRPRRPARGRRRHRQDRGDGRPLLPPRLRQGGLPDAILAFTFTDKAAAELRQRIRAELTRRAEAGSERAAEVLSAIGGAWVTTIHGFCNRLLAGHPVAAGIDPGFRVLDAPETARAAREAFDEALREFLADAGEGQRRARRRSPALRASRAAGDRGRRPCGAAEPRRGRAAAAGAAAERPGRGDRDGDRSSRQALEEMKRERPQTRAGRAGAGATERAGAAAGAGRAAGAAHRQRGQGDRSPTARRSRRRSPARAEAGEGGEAYRHLAELLELFSAGFEAAKERRAGIDFEDLQILAARLLERAEIGEAYRARFSHLLVDEFQDTNRLQLRLIEALRGPRSELVVVGDELQSIYGFRHADLDVFRAQRERSTQRADAELMELSGNFRSRPELIAAVNHFGAALLGAAYRPLRVGAPTAARSRRSAGGPPVELLLTARDGWDAEEIELEPAIDGAHAAQLPGRGALLAARLRELADAGVPRGEMVVLLRAFTHLDAYEDSLERAGLRPYVVGGRGYWSQQQVSDVCALLATIANPLDDQALFGALASPACGAAPDTLWLLRAAAGKRPPRLAGAGARRRCRRGGAGGAGAAGARSRQPELELLRGFVATIGALRERGPRLSAGRADRGGGDRDRLRPGGADAPGGRGPLRQRAQADAPRRRVRGARGPRPARPARLPRRPRRERRRGQAATAAEGHDGVRIMTVHNAKGLEFGVVAVPDLSRSLLAGARPPLLTLGREQPPRVGMQLRRLGSGAINLFDYAELCEEAKERDAEEGLRLFHVAATAPASG